jgi:hypothetical protein
MRDSAAPDSATLHPGYSLLGLAVSDDEILVAVQFLGGGLDLPNERLFPLVKVKILDGAG